MGKTPPPARSDFALRASQGQSRSRARTTQHSLPFGLLLSLSEPKSIDRRDRGYGYMV